MSRGCGKRKLRVSKVRTPGARTYRVTARRKLGKYRRGTRIAGTATARQTRLNLRGRGQEKQQNQRSKEESAEGQGLTHPAGSADLALLPHPPVRGSAVHVRGRHRTQKQQAEEGKDGGQTSPRGSMLQLVHRVGKQA